MRPALLKAIGAILIGLMVSCSSPPLKSNPRLEMTKELLRQEIPGAAKVSLFDYLEDERLYPKSDLDAPLLSRNHNEIYRALAFGETLKTQVAVRHLDGVITIVLDESSVRRVMGFVQLNLKTKRLIFNFGPEFGVFHGEMTDSQIARAEKKLNEIRGHYSLSKEDPFQFYYNTTATFRMKDQWTYVAEAGELKTFVKGENKKINYERENQKHRCATDLFWIIYEMIGEGRSPSDILTP